MKKFPLLQFAIPLLAFCLAILSSGSVVAQSPPVPVATDTWIFAEDYPKSARDNNVVGRVGYKLEVNKLGLVSNCTVILSSGDPALDGQTCISMKNRARFIPAKNAKGTPVAGCHAATMSWTLDELRPQRFLTASQIEIVRSACSDYQIKSVEDASQNASFASENKEEVETANVQIVSKIADISPRIALLIGNSRYGKNMGSLKNPVRDVLLLAKTMRALGFDVEVLTDANQKQMKRAISRLGARMQDAGKGATGLFFFAGHGAQSRGINYLIPVDAPINREADLSLEAVSASDVLFQMEESVGSTSLIILDACRNMPLLRSFRNGSRGLARMDAPNGSFIAYSTAPGSVAYDGDGQNSPFASALNKHIQTDGMPIETVFRNVRKQVYENTDGLQTPWDASSLINTFVFRP